MLPILNKLIILFFVPTSIFALELKCAAGKIEQTEFGKTKIEKSEYCFNKNKTLLISKPCYQSHCEKSLSQKKFKMSELFSDIGKPGFKLCRELNGRPEIITFFVENVPYKLDRCLFKEGNFIDTDYLLSLYLER